MSPRTYIIALDGPAGSGKSTTARLVAGKLGFIFLDTGAMYRAVTFLALEQNIRLDDAKALGKLSSSVSIDFKEDSKGQRVFADGRDITCQIRTPEVTASVSQVSAHAEVRKYMVAQQKQIGREHNLVAEGRDTTSVVFPEAVLKVYLDASLEERAYRRLLEFEKMHKQTTLAEQIENLRLRDEYDSGRKVSPLLRTPDAITIDTTDLTIEEQVDKVIALFKEKIPA